MNREEFEALGDKHKKFEGMYYHYFLPNIPIVVRLDGRAFHTFTKGLNRPFDERLSNMMIDTTIELVKQTHASIGYTQSDEITLVFSGSDQPLFGGRQSKIETTLAAIASAKFNQLLMTTIPEKVSLLPTFDARAFQYPTKELAVESLIWRETDATRNSLTMLAHAHYSHKELQGKGFKAKHDMLHAVGVNWNDMPVHFKRGTYIKRQVKTSWMDDDTWNKIPVKHRPDSRYVSRSIVGEFYMNPIEGYDMGQLVELVFS